MEISTLVFLIFVVLAVSDVQAARSGPTLADRVAVMEKEIKTSKFETAQAETKRMELAIQMELALAEVDSLNSSLQDTQSHLRVITQELRRVRQERDTYSECLGQLRDDMNKTAADLRDARMLISELNSTNQDIFATKQQITGLTKDLMTLNLSCCVVRDEAKETDGNESSMSTSSLSEVSLTTSTTTYPGTTAGTINLARGKPATASSVYGTHPEVATDGLPYTDWKSGSCFAVAEGDNHPWWQVDLEAYSEMFEVAVTSRSDCCPERLHDFTLEVFRKNPATSTGARSALCGTYNGTVTEPGKTVSVECIRSVRGRYVRLRGTKDGEGDLLQFCEVKVFGSIIADGESNLARGKPATASSVYGPHPEVATDGLPYTDWKRGSCFTVAEGDDHPWWQVDLEAYSEVFEVAVTSRGDCCPERLHDFTLEVFRKNPATSTGARSALCGTYNGTVTEPGKTVSVECIRSVRGRYVRLMGTKDGEGDLLQFCEVKVFGFIIADGESNLARGKPATASSVYGPLPRVATDGLPNTDWGSGSCFAVAEGDDHPWWQVDLEAYSEVFEVAVTSRGDCCPERLHNFTLEVFTKPGARGALCGSYHGAVAEPGKTVTVKCTRPVQGRYVRLSGKRTVRVTSLSFVRSRCSVMRFNQGL
ncbi:uncharacterized protein LOC124258206 [Haliotis rubra]|uniref:uncharacterized protein LOC124258206 n=1 Tax=Haliotis rubra TaxID=36100 RepID=UPI001EE5830F|nr:uncharacterized protein LOC124258206 [Haliotis rubra]